MASLFRRKGKTQNFAISEAKPPSRRLLLLLVLYLVLIYSNSLQVPFLFDDRMIVRDRPELHWTHLTPRAVVDTFYLGGKLYRPISCLTFGINYYVGHHEVAGYHLINITVHLITAVFLYKSLLILVNLGRAPLRRRHMATVAGLAAIFWAAHPIQVQAVTYIVQRMASLAAMFYVLGLWSYLKFRGNNGNSEKGAVFSGWKWGCLSLLFFCCGVGSKENAALFPIGILLLEFFFFDGYEKIQSRPVKGIGTGVIVLLLFVVTGLHLIGGVEGMLSGYELMPFTLKQRVLTETRVLFFYLSQLFYPVPDRFSLIHFLPVSQSFFTPFSTFFAVLGIFIVLVLGFVVGIRLPLIGFPVLFYFTHHAAESTVFPLELIYEHRNYLPSLLLFLPVAIAFTWLLDYFHERNAALEKAFIGFLIAIIFFLGLSTYLRNQDWRTPLSFWQHEVVAAPELIRPYKGLARCYSRSETLDIARAFFYYHKGIDKRAYFSKMEKAMMWYNLGILHKHRRNNYQAKRAILRAIEHCSGLNTAHRKVERYMAMLYYELAQICHYSDQKEALKYIDKALSREVQPAYLHAKSLYLVHSGEYEQALTVLQQALRQAPAFSLRGEIYLRLGQIMTASGHYDRGYWFLKQYIAHVASSKDAFYVPVYLYLADNRYSAGKSTLGKKYVEKYLRAVSLDSLESFRGRLREGHPEILPFDNRQFILEQLRRAPCNLAVKSVGRENRQN